ncbi:MAG TPA: tryptophan 2,3-dioxygenase family protein [Polyangia bacterium]|nr:tryptophan 2,3-dioxygenase family protein [Polyangia bacterium]
MAGPPLTDYEKYLRTEELLALQKAPGELVTHDEMQFQIVHQVAELWMKLVAHEIDRLIVFLGQDQIAGATYALNRISEVQRLLEQQLRLLDTMSPKDYMTIRTALGRGSGQESPGFRHLLKVPRDIWVAFVALLERKKVSLRQIHETPHRHAELFALAEGLTDFDQALQLWRWRHLMLVYRIIGAGTPSLKGKPVDLLERGVKERFFPELWQVRDELFAEWTAQAKKDMGYH